MTKIPAGADLKVGANIRQLRQRIGMSQEKLAEHLKITFQQVQKYEKGTNRVSASRLVEIARVFNVTVSALFEGAAEANAGETPALPAISSDAQKLAMDFETITDANVRLSIRGLVKSLSRQQVANAA
ncbi:helix-turn-helix transcriptional regulator [Rhizobium sp. Leaf386]|uniref:helix-turn-helix domain-containing protein n=1 Tax=Rhizobium sp. Leaf386 TaxID=1736359 RepID=UPI0007162CAF|nr:helix-turn-helix transcriptional regulator [Rhizobium sp. Leaf386]KQS95366.1 hypothetical protein ASG50_25410 [Rhizobium sp. Leaf386]